MLTVGKLSDIKIQTVTYFLLFQYIATNAADVVIKHNDIKETTPEGTSQDSSTPASARRQWGGRANTVLNVLEQANITEVANTTSVQDPKSKPDKLPQPEQSSVSASEGVKIIVLTNRPT